MSKKIAMLTSWEFSKSGDADLQRKVASKGRQLTRKQLYIFHILYDQAEMIITA